MGSSAMPVDSPFAAEGGASPARVPDDDPLGSLDDLMAVVEALCGTWPPRDGFRPVGTMLL